VRAQQQHYHRPAPEKGTEQGEKIIDCIHLCSRFARQR